MGGNSWTSGECLGLRFGKWGFPGRDSVSPLGIETFLGALTRRQPVLTVVEWLENGIQSRKFWGRKVGNLGWKVQRPVGGVRKEDGPSKRGIGPGRKD